MKKEVLSAVNFLVDIIRVNSSSCNLTDEQLDKFRHHVCECLWQHYENHWFPEFPERGSGYRCIRINGSLDPLIERAGKLVGLAVPLLRASFPSELTMWVDPSEVAYRIGENGSICNIMDKSGAPEKPTSQTTPTKSTPQKILTPSSPQVNAVSQLKHQGHRNFHAYSPSRGGNSPTGRPTYYSPPRSPVFELLPQARRNQHQFPSSPFYNNLSNCKDSLRGHGFESNRMIERLFVSS